MKSLTITILLITLFTPQLLLSGNLITNPDFDDGLDDWIITDGTVAQTDGDDNIAYLSGENGVLYQQVDDIEVGKTYTCTIVCSGISVKQSTGYGYAIEKETPITFPEFTIGASQMNGVCNNNDGLWIQPPGDASGPQTFTFDITVPSGATSVYICMATKGAVANMSVTSVLLEEAETNEVIFTVKDKQADALLKDAEITIDGVPNVYLTGTDGTVAISLIPSETPYQINVERNWFKRYEGELSVTAGVTSHLIEIDSIVEIKNVVTRISKYGDNATPYPLYGHLWNNGLAYSQQEMELMANGFDYIIGGGTMTNDSNQVNNMHGIDENFQVIRYSGGWTRSKSFSEGHKMELTYYRIGNLSANINETATELVIASPPTKGRGLIASEEDNFDIWIRCENELMKVTNVSSTSNYPITVNVERGFNGTMPVAHTSGKAITLPLYGTPPKEGENGGDISYFVTTYGARKYVLEETLFNEAREYNYDGIWIDILLGRLSATSLFNNNYEEWDHTTETALSGANDVKYVKQALDELYEKFYSRMGYYPVIYGNNVLYAQSLGTGDRAWTMVKEPQYNSVLDGFCHENTWGHVGSDGSGIDHEGVIEEAEGHIREYGEGDRYLNWHINDQWIDHSKAVALLAQNNLPNQPMTINAGFKNQWFAESFPNDTRYRFNRFCYVSYLLSVDVKADSSISCRMGISPMRVNGPTTIEIEPYFYYQLGLPVERYTYNNFTKYRHGSHNLYTRTFKNGLVLINPFPNAMDEAVNIADIVGNNVVHINPENDSAVVTSVQLDSLESMILLTKNGSGNQEKIITDEVEITVFPNPANHILNIQFKTPMEKTETIRVYNMAGAVLEQKLVVSGNATLNIVALPQGVYFIRFVESNQVIRFIKE